MMDKGLKILNELKIKLEELNSKYEKIEDKINAEEQSVIILEGNQIQLQLNLDELNNKKDRIENAPRKIKEEQKQAKKLLGIVASFAYIVLSAGIIIDSLINNYGIQMTLQTLGVSFCGDLLGFGILYPIMFCDIQKRYPIGNLSEIIKEIDEVTNAINLNKSKIQQSKAQITTLSLQRDDIEKEIELIIGKINSIRELREKVISDYCKDNEKLDNLLNTAYDEKIEGRQKTKNGNK